MPFVESRAVSRLCAPVSLWQRQGCLSDDEAISRPNEPEKRASWILLCESRHFLSES